MTSRSEQFGRLLKAGIGSIANCEAKTAPAVEADIGEQIGIAGHTIQRYKAGHLPAEARTIEILAEACVRRGYLNREWLQAFLRAAHYPTPDMLLDRLCPAGPGRVRPERVYQNLPAPSYSQFVMRQQAYNDMLDGLAHRSPVVLIASLGGMGKTSLVREVAANCLGNSDATLHFDAVVWVSDKNRAGTTNLSVVLDEIARTLDYPGMTQFAYDDKRREVEQLLRCQKVLLVIDNFETITDRALLDWVLRLPEPSKAIITTREYHREFRSSWPVDLGGMTHDEAQLLIDQRLKLLKLDSLVGDRSQFAPLIAATGGNPKAIELSLGLIKYERRSLHQIVDDLYAARGALFDDLFARAWSLLDVPARHVLVSLTLFPASASQAALATIASVSGLTFDLAADKLADLALVDTQRASIHDHPRYALHPLVRAFAQGQLASLTDFDVAARQRWLEWCRQLAARVGFCWDDLGRLELLDQEHNTIHAAIMWAVQNKQYATVIELIEGVRYYYNVRGLWDERLTINRIRADAARRIGDRSNEVLALAHHVEIRSKQGMLDEAAKYYEQLEAAERAAALTGEVRFEVQHARALYARACGDLSAAQQIWLKLLDLSSVLGGQKYIVNRRWLATCLYQQGKLAEAQQLFRDSLQDALQIQDQRSVIGNMLKLVAIDLDQGNTVDAQARLAECHAAAEYLQDRRRLAEVHRLSARMHRMRGDQRAAESELLAAIDLFERLGMRRELNETRGALQSLTE